MSTEFDIAPVVTIAEGRLCARCCAACPQFLDRPHVLPGPMVMEHTGYCQAQPVLPKAIINHSHQPVIVDQTGCVPWYERGFVVWIDVAAKGDRRLVALFPVGVPVVRSEHQETMTAKKEECEQ